MPSNAVGPTRVASVTGYSLEGEDFSNNAPVLPQRIIVFGEANTDKQVGLNITQNQIVSEQQAATDYGPGSPMHIIARILKPKFGDGVGGIPVVCIAQVEAVAAETKEIEITVTGPATGDAVHNIIVAGRDNIDGEIYSFEVKDGDSDNDIATKMGDSITSVLASPLRVVSIALGVLTVETKWKGLTAADLTLDVDNNDKPVGVAYAFLATQAGSGTPDISPALATFGEQWNTLVINTYGTIADVVTKLEIFNGIPKTVSNPAPTGQFQPIIQRPFNALTGSVADNDIVFTDAHKDDVTIAICPAPRSAGFPMEAAANTCAIYAPIAQAAPHKDSAGNTYPDMPTPEDIGPMGDYDNRDLYIKAGNSIVTLSAGRYKIEGLVSTYHPAGETVPQHRYVRNRTVDSNFRFVYHLREVDEVLNKTIAGDNDTIIVADTIKPKEWKSSVFEMIDQLAQLALITDPQFSKDSVIVNLSEINPDRFETSLSYKRTGVARILSTTVKAGFNFGTL